MKKRVLLLAVSCKTGGLCPGGIDLDNPKNWIRIVKDDGKAGAVQGRDIDFAKPLDVIAFDGRPMPQGRQLENWVSDNNSCKNAGRGRIKGKDITTDRDLLNFAYNNYSYNGFWGNNWSYLNETQFNSGDEPSESIMKVSNVRIYSYSYGSLVKAKIDFDWNGNSIQGISMTDQDFYDRIRDNEVHFNEAIIVVSIPKDCDWTHPGSGEKRAYKFVSRVFEI